jgi:hypothetical protein
MRHPVAVQERRAATLVELIIGITVLAMVLAIAIAQVARLQRTYSAVTDDMEARARLRDGADMLRSELRGIGAAGRSLMSIADTAIEFYSATGTSTLCLVSPGSTITLPPDTLPSGRILSSWAFAPDVGDVILILTDSTAPAIPHWQSASVTSVARVPAPAGCPASTEVLTPPDVAAPQLAYQLQLDSVPAAGIHSGAPVRVVRRVRYDVYRAGDGNWYLGYRTCISACAGVQPVSGPYGGGARPPIVFHFFGRSGALVSAGSVADVARIDIVLHASYPRPFRLPGMATGVLSDSVTTSVALRNQS